MFKASRFLLTVVPMAAVSLTVSAQSYYPNIADVPASYGSYSDYYGNQGYNDYGQAGSYDGYGSSGYDYYQSYGRAYEQSYASDPYYQTPAYGYDQVYDQGYGYDQSGYNQGGYYGQSYQYDSQPAYNQDATGYQYGYDQNYNQTPYQNSQGYAYDPAYQNSQGYAYDPAYQSGQTQSYNYGQVQQPDPYAQAYSYGQPAYQQSYYYPRPQKDNLAWVKRNLKPEKWRGRNLGEEFWPGDDSIYEDVLPVHGPWDRNWGKAPWNRPYEDLWGDEGGPDAWFDIADPKEALAWMWEDMLYTPNALGTMPGGWEAPTISVPNPIDVGDEFKNASTDFPGEMKDFADGFTYGDRTITGSKPKKDGGSFGMGNKKKKDGINIAPKQR